MVSASESTGMQVNIFVSCRKLRKLDTFSDSDPTCFMYLFNQVSQKWVKQGHTEQIMNSLNPNFSTSFTMDYYFEKH